VKLSYNKLWKILIDRNIKKGKLQIAIGVSKGTMARMSKNEPVSMKVLLAICKYLRCDFGDIVEAVPTEVPTFPMDQNKWIFKLT